MKTAKKQATENNEIGKRIEKLENDMKLVIKTVKARGIKLNVQLPKK